MSPPRDGEISTRKAARLLGTHRNTVYRWIQDHALVARWDEQSKRYWVEEKTVRRMLIAVRG